MNRDETSAGPAFDTDTAKTVIGTLLGNAHDTAALSGAARAASGTSTADVPRVGADLDAVLFDAGGVIMVPDPIIIGTALSPFGGTTDLATLVRAHYLAMRAHAGSSHEGEARWLDSIVAVVAAAGVDADRVDEAMVAFARVFGHRSWRFPVMETVVAMERLREMGTPLGVVSNAAGQVEGVLRNQSCCQVGPGGGVEVDVIIDSAVVGIEKPDPAIFTPALEVMAARGATDPARIGYVGDSVIYDIAGARAAGLVPLLLDPYDDHADMDLGPGAHRIRSVHDLLPIN